MNILIGSYSKGQLNLFCICCIIINWYCNRDKFGNTYIKIWQHYITYNKVNKFRRHLTYSSTFSATLPFYNHTITFHQSWPYVVSNQWSTVFTVITPSVPVHKNLCQTTLLTYLAISIEDLLSVRKQFAVRSQWNIKRRI